VDELQEIIKGCCRNEPVSQEKLYKQFYPAFFALCRRFFSDNHDAITALNNGMLKIFKHINEYDVAKGSFFSWSYTIIRNAALTLIRDKKPNLTFELTEDSEEAYNSNPFKHLEWKDIYYYLAKLSPNTRYVCTLFYLEGFSIKEIVSSLDMKEGTVKWHLGECRKQLKIIIDQPGFKNGG
jgi:RNA polymerase sigma factor (sigma-70 family)